MAKPHFYYDKTEIIVAQHAGKGYIVHHVPADKMRKIRFNPFMVKKLFKTVPTEMILIEAAGFPPMMLVKAQEEQYFESYKNDLRKFAKDNHIFLEDNTALTMDEMKAKMEAEQSAQ